MRVHWLFVLVASELSFSASSLLVPPLPPLSGGTLALLTLPTSPADTVRNAAILDAALARALPLTGRPPEYRPWGDQGEAPLPSHPPLYVSVAPSLRHPKPPTGAVISYVSDLYRQVWDHVSTNLLLPPRSDSSPLSTLLDVVIFPHLPGSSIAPRSSLPLSPQLDCVVYDDSLDATALLRPDSELSEKGSLPGAVLEHLNSIRKSSGDKPLSFHHVPSSSPPSRYVYYADLCHSPYLPENFEPSSPSSSHKRHSLLYEKVGVAGTFCTLHYGHRLLLTLANLCHSQSKPPSPPPVSQGLIIGIVTSSAARSSRRLDGGSIGHDSTTTTSATSSSSSTVGDVSSFKERSSRVLSFVSTLRGAPIVHNGVSSSEVSIVPISDGVGPAGDDPDLQALVLSSETAGRGEAINEIRRKGGRGMMDIVAVCRREMEGMSATNLRKRGVR